VDASARAISLVTFLYPFLTFFQPGRLWPVLSDYRPILVISLLAMLIALSRRSTYPRQWLLGSHTFIWLVIFIFFQSLSVYRGGIMNMVNELVFWAGYLFFVMVSVLLISDVTALRRYVLGMIAGGLFVVGYGIYSVFSVGGYEGTGRAGAYGMYENHNDYSFIIIQIIPFIYMLMINESSTIRRYLLVASLISCVVGIFLSLSRGGVLALILEAALIVIIGIKSKRRIYLLPILAVVGALAISYQWDQRAENQQTGYTAETAESSRLELWRVAERMVKANPLLGVGSRRFGEYSLDYMPDMSASQKGKNSHNTFIEIVATSGLLGFFSFAFMSYYLWRDLTRKTVGVDIPWLEAIQKATLVSFYSIYFRALLDAKTEDWSCYVLVAIGISCALLRTLSEQPSKARPTGSLPY
jgi:O-antigen ligase